MSEQAWINNTVACSISIHSWGNNKGVKASDVNLFSSSLAEKTAKKAVTVRKRLIECDAYKAIISRDGFAQRWFSDHSVPSLLRRGIYAVPTRLLEEWRHYVAMYIDERESLVWQFERAYADARWQARLELGELYRAEDYPEERDVRQKFYVEVRYLDLSVPDRLEAFDPQLYAQARREFQEAVEQGKAAIEHMLAEEVAEMVKGLREALHGLDDGTLKRFHESHVEKIREWSQLFLAGRNVTDNSELQQTIEALQAVVQSQSVYALKSFSGARQTVKRELASCLDNLKGFMEARPTRKIEID